LRRFVQHAEACQRWKRHTRGSSRALDKARKMARRASQNDLPRLTIGFK
jgi:hypothetical protein